MTYFDKYVSNTCAGSGNQMYFNMNEDEVRTGRMFYKIFAAENIIIPFFSQTSLTLLFPTVP